MNLESANLLIGLTDAGFEELISPSRGGRLFVKIIGAVAYTITVAAPLDKITAFTCWDITTSSLSSEFYFTAVPIDDSRPTWLYLHSMSTGQTRDPKSIPVSALPEVAALKKTHRAIGFRGAYAWHAPEQVMTADVNSKG